MASAGKHTAGGKGGKTYGLWQARENVQPAANANRARGEEREKINACTHTFVQAVPAFRYKVGYAIGYFTSRDPRMVFKDVTRSHFILQFDHVQ